MSFILNYKPEFMLLLFSFVSFLGAIVSLYLSKHFQEKDNDTIELREHFSRWVYGQFLLAILFFVYFLYVMIGKFV